MISGSRILSFFVLAVSLSTLGSAQSQDAPASPSNPTPDSSAKPGNEEKPCWETQKSKVSITYTKDGKVNINTDCLEKWIKADQAKKATELDKKATALDEKLKELD